MSANRSNGLSGAHLLVYRLHLSAHSPQVHPRIKETGRSSSTTVHKETADHGRVDNVQKSGTTNVCDEFYINIFFSFSRTLFSFILREFDGTRLVHRLIYVYMHIYITPRKTGQTLHFSTNYVHNVHPSTWSECTFTLSRSLASVVSLTVNDSTLFKAASNKLRNQYEPQLPLLFNYFPVLVNEGSYPYISANSDCRRPYTVHDSSLCSSLYSPNPPLLILCDTFRSCKEGFRNLASWSHDNL